MDHQVYLWVSIEKLSMLEALDRGGTSLHAHVTYEAARNACEYPVQVSFRADEYTFLEKGYQDNGTLVQRVLISKKIK